MSKLALLLVASLALVACVCASAPFSPAARSHALSVLSSQRVSASAGWGSAEATAAALEAYKGLGVAAPQADKLCATLNKELLAAIRTNKIEPARWALSAAAQAQCSGFSVPAPQLKTMLQAALNSKQLESVSHAAQAAFALAGLKSSLTLADFDFSAVDDLALELLEEDGSVRSSPEDDEGSAFHAGLALELLGDLSAKVPASVDKAVLRQFADKVSALVSLGFVQNNDKVDFTQGAPAEITPLEAIAVVLEGVRTIATVVAEPLNIQKPQLVIIGDALLRYSFVSNSQDAAALVSSLQFLASNPVFVPYYIAVPEQAAGKAAAAGALKIQVTNILGQATTKLNVVVESAKSTAKAGTRGALTLKDMTFTPASSSADNTEYSLTEASVSQFAKAAPGFYEFKLNVAPVTAGGKFQPQSGLTLLRKVVASRESVVRGSVLEFVVADSAKLTTKDEKAVVSVKYPEVVPALSKVPAVEASKHIHLRLKLASSVFPRPSAVFLQVVGEAREALFVMRPASAGTSTVAPEDEGVYTLKLSLGSSDVVDALAGAGTYSLSIMLGDATLDGISSWNIGSAKLNVPAPSTSSGRLDREALFAPKPTIAHSFRAPDSRPAGVISLFFTGLVVAAFVGLVLAVLKSGVRLSLPSHPSELVYAAIFQVSIAAILLSYALYWIGLNIFQELTLLAVFGIVAIFSGTGALRLLHQRSGAKDGKVE